LSRLLDAYFHAHGSLDEVGKQSTLTGYLNASCPLDTPLVLGPRQKMGKVAFGAVSWLYSESPPNLDAIVRGLNG